VLLRNQLYAGIVDVPEYGVRNKRGDFEPVLSEEIFFRVQAVLSGHAPTPAPKLRSHPDFPFRNLRALRVVPARTHRELVEGTARVLRVLPLPSRLPWREHHQVKTRGTVR
jgi:hypothetical protein